MINLLKLLKETLEFADQKSSNFEYPKSVFVRTLHQTCSGGKLHFKESVTMIQSFLIMLSVISILKCICTMEFGSQAALSLVNQDFVKLEQFDGTDYSRWQDEMIFY